MEGTKRQKQGFTLSELLIVVAIIAVLTSIAIPAFSGLLEQSKEAVDLANIRSAYAEAAMAVLDGREQEFRVVMTQDVDGWGTKNQTAQIGRHAVMDKLPEIKAKCTVVISVNSAGEPSFSIESIP